MPGGGTYIGFHHGSCSSTCTGQLYPASDVLWLLPPEFYQELKALVRLLVHPTRRIANRWSNRLSAITLPPMLVNSPLTGHQRLRLRVGCNPVSEEPWWAHWPRPLTPIFPNASHDSSS